MAKYSAENFAGYSEGVFYEALKDEFSRWDWEQLQFSEEYL